MQPVGELNQQHADILGHCKHEFTEILGVLGLVRLQLQLTKLGHAIDETGDRRTEMIFDLLEGSEGVFHRVVQKRCNDGITVEFERGQDTGDFERMGKIRIAAGASLRSMGLERKYIGAVE